MKKKDYGRLLAKARDDWFKSPEGKRCMSPEILSLISYSQFLKNRLQTAFIAGADATRKISK